MAALVFWRLLPYTVPTSVAYYLFNVTPLGAACVFTGAVLVSSGQAVGLSLASVVCSDVCLTLMGWAPIPGVRHVLIMYPLYLAMTVLGRWWLSRQRNWRRISLTCLASGMLFLLVADFQTWWLSPEAPLPQDMPADYLGRLLYAFGPEPFLTLRGYPKTLEGLITCYLMGLPFSLRFVTSTVVFGWVFFGAWAWAEHRATVWQSWGQAEPASLTR